MLGMEKLNGLDLFSGIGGNTLALRDYTRTIAYCEFEPHAQGVLLSRMRDGSIEPAPIWDDVRTLKAEHIGERIDIIVAGFPCQDISNGGSKEGIAGGEKSALYFEVARLVGELKPTFVFLENVAAIATRGLDVVLGTLTEMGYDCRWCIVSAQEVGANHQRERWFLLAHSNSGRREEHGVITPSISGGSSQALRDNESAQIQRHGSVQDVGKARGSGASSGLFSKPENKDWANPAQWWNAESSIPRTVDALPYRMDRIERLGNAVVPAQAKEAFEILSGIK